jgi:hypothetical protein
MRCHLYRARDVLFVVAEIWTKIQASPPQDDSQRALIVPGKENVVRNHFPARGGELVHLVYLVYLVFLVYLVRRTRENRQTRATDRLTLSRSPLPSPHTKFPQYSSRRSLHDEGVEQADP